MHPASADFPTWVTVVATASLLLGGACAVWVLVDLRRRPPAMPVMAVVWPVTMLFGSVLWLWLYLRVGRAPRRDDRSGSGGHPGHGTGHHRARTATDAPAPAAVAVGASHCGAGCALGDIVGELVVLLAVPAAFASSGWLFGDPMYGHWAVDFVLAFAFGIVLQYFAIAPMRGLGLGRGLREAVKADTASIAAWQVGMFGVMALAQLLVLPALFGGRAEASTPEFWFTMQLAMIAGFVTSYPVNRWLIRRGIKEVMT